jgi:hypothetical protein
VGEPANLFSFSNVITTLTAFLLIRYNKQAFTFSSLSVARKDIATALHAFVMVLTAGLNSVLFPPLFVSLNVTVLPIFFAVRQPP